MPIICCQNLLYTLPKRSNWFLYCRHVVNLSSIMIANILIVQILLSMVFIQLMRVGSWLNPMSLYAYILWLFQLKGKVHCPYERIQSENGFCVSKVFSTLVTNWSSASLIWLLNLMWKAIFLTIKTRIKTTNKPQFRIICKSKPKIKTN